MLYLPSSNCSCCSKCPVEDGSWYSSDGSTSTHDRNAKQVQHIHIHANKSKSKETVQQYIKTAKKTMLELFYTLQQ